MTYFCYSFDIRDPSNNIMKATDSLQKKKNANTRIYTYDFGLQITGSLSFSAIDIFCCEELYSTL